MGLLDTFSRWSHPRSEEAPPLWSELSFRKKLSIAFEVVLALTTVFGIVILILEVSGL